MLRAAVSLPTETARHQGTTRKKQSDDDKIHLLITEERGTKTARFAAYEFNSVEMVKRRLKARLGLSKSKVSDIKLFYKGIEVANQRALSSFATEKRRSKWRDGARTSDGTKGKDYIRLSWRLADRDTSVGIRCGVSTAHLTSKKMRLLVKQAEAAFMKGVSPKLGIDGTSGSYRLTNWKGSVVGIFKPGDEEPFSPNNPRKFVGRMGQPGMRHGLRSGDSYLRECISYYFDQLYDLIGIPPTCVVEARHPAFCYNCYVDMANLAVKPLPLPEGKRVLYWKTGSFQVFISATECAGDYNPDMFPVSQVQRIALFDICVMNLDRNDGNLLVQKREVAHQTRPTWVIPYTVQSDDDDDRQTHASRGEEKRGSPNGETDAGKYPPGKRRRRRVATPKELQTTLSGEESKYILVPIDHGLTFPDSPEIADFDWTWFQWPQCRVPIGKTELQMLFQMHPDADAADIKGAYAVRDAPLRTFRVCTRLAKIGAAMHLNVHQIASIACREGDHERPSILELLVKESLVRACNAVIASPLVVVQPRNMLPAAITMDNVASPYVGLRAPMYNLLRKPARDPDDSSASASVYADSPTRKVETPALIATFSDNYLDRHQGVCFNGVEEMKWVQNIKGSPERDNSYAAMNFEVLARTRTMTMGEDASSGGLPLSHGCSRGGLRLRLPVVEIPPLPAAPYSQRAIAVSRKATEYFGLPKGGYKRRMKIAESNMLEDFASIQEICSDILGTDEDFQKEYDLFRHRFLRAVELRRSIADGDIACSGLTGIPFVDEEEDLTCLMVTQPIHNREKAKEKSWTPCSMGVRNLPLLAAPRVHDRLEPKYEEPRPLLTPAFRTNFTTTRPIARNDSARASGSQQEADIWTVLDKDDMPVELDWNNSRFDEVFFSVLEETIAYCIQTNHPDWMKYPWNGDALSDMNLESHAASSSSCSGSSSSTSSCQGSTIAPTKSIRSHTPGESPPRIGGVPGVPAPGGGIPRHQTGSKGLSRLPILREPPGKEQPAVPEALPKKSSLPGGAVPAPPPLFRTSRRG